MSLAGDLAAIRATVKTLRENGFPHWRNVARELERKRAQREPAHTNGRRRQRRKHGYQAFPSKRGRK